VQVASLPSKNIYNKLSGLNAIGTKYFINGSRYKYYIEMIEYSIVDLIEENQKYYIELDDKKYEEIPYQDITE
jgi:hypothetical protein